MNITLKTNASARALAFTTTLLILILNLDSKVVAQVGTYSQYHLLPNVTNPANAAMIDVTQLSIHYRQQSLSSGFSYKTGGISYNQPLFNKNGDRRFAGYGITILHDRSGVNDMLRTTQAMAGFAYNLSLSDQQFLSFGMQASYVFSNINLDGITTNSQFGPLGYDQSLATGENLGSGKASAFQLNAGFTWYAVNQEGRTVAQLGIAGYNINKPNYSFIQNSDAELPIRYIVHGGLTIFDKQNFQIQPTFRWIVEAGSKKLNLGSRFQYNLEGNSRIKSNTGAIAANLWYSNNKTAVFSIDFSQPKFIVGVSYDLPIAAKQTNQQINNALEIVLSLKIGRVHSKQESTLNPKSHGLSENIIEERESILEDTLASSTPNPKEVEEVDQTLLPDIAQQDSTIKKKGLSVSERNLFDRQLRFKFNSTELTEDSGNFLVAMANALKNHPEYDLRITGHTCNIGSEHYNQTLSLQRALEVKKILIRLGVSSGRIYTEGAGPFKPAFTNSSEDGRQRNRRVEFKLIYK